MLTKVDFFFHLDLCSMLCHLFLNQNCCHCCAISSEGSRVDDVYVGEGLLHSIVVMLVKVCCILLWLCW